MDRRTILGTIAGGLMTCGLGAIVAAASLPPHSRYFSLLLESGFGAVAIGVVSFVLLYIFQPKVKQGEKLISGDDFLTHARSNVRFRDDLNRLKHSDLNLARYKDHDLPDKVTIEYLFDQCEDKTELQCSEATKVYLGGRLKVRGKVTSVTLLHASVTIALYVPYRSHERGLYMIFDNDIDKARLAALPKNTVIEATGRLYEITGHEIKLADCRLLHVF